MAVEWSPTFWPAGFFQLSAALAVVTAVLGYAYSTYHYGKWKRLGVPQPGEPTPLFGHLFGPILGRVPLVNLVNELYGQLDGCRYFGIYEARNPLLVLRDPALVHLTMVGNFSHFVDRNAGKVSFKYDRLFDHLFNIRGEQWKAVRAKISPTFTSAKLKSMMGDMNECTDRLIDHLDGQIKDNNGVVNVNEASAQFTTDTIGRCAFGLDCNALSNPDSEFRRAGRAIVTPSRRSSILNFIRLIDFGWLLDVFRVCRLSDHVYEFFDNMFETAMDQHKNGQNNRNDFIALLVRLKEDEQLIKDGTKLFTNDILAANTFVFFVAGFETTSSTISYCLYELATNPEIQVKLREIVKQKLDENEGEFPYDTLKELQYLDMVINETLRLHPPVPLLNRVCTKKYQIPDTDITLNVGEKLLIPAYSLHHDPKYYPNPEKFDPERFTDENKALRPNGTFLPFGDGPRICIGMRFALMEVKIGLADIISKFEVRPCKNTVKSPIKLLPNSFFLTPNDPILLTFEKIE